MATAFATDTQRLSNVVKFECDEIPGYCRKAVRSYEATAKTYQPGTVLVRNLNTPVATATAKSGNTGTGSIGTVTAFSTALLGTYNLRIVAAASNAGTFIVTAPDGRTAYGTVAVAFLGLGLSFTLADSTDFIVGDEISIVVTATREEYSIPTADKIDGSLVIFVCDAKGNYGNTAIAATTYATYPDIVVLHRGPARVADTGLILDASIDTAAEKNAVYAILEAKGIQVDTQI